jgi:uncharacterized protein YcbK (DUF882 family)
MSTRQRRRFVDAIIVGMGVTFASLWVVAIVHAVATDAPRPGLAERMTTNPLSSGAAPPTAFLLDAALQRFAERSGYGGLSGQVMVAVSEAGDSVEFAAAAGLPEELADSVDVLYVSEAGDTVAARAGAAPPPGEWTVLLHAEGETRPVPNLRVLAAVPMTQRSGGRIGRYMIGAWPFEDGSEPKTPAYAAPRGMVRVTPENQDMHVSRHFQLRHFLTKGQDDVWPKYVLISPRVLDKLELTIDELNASGVRVERVGVISGFRTPHYNVGGGNPSGRGSLSRHMYGDAMDWFVDNDGDGRMDDLNGDGRVDIEDARVMAAAAERVERRHPELIGGIGVYRPTGAHSGFIHIDTRGYRARW